MASSLIHSSTTDRTALLSSTTKWATGLRIAGSSHVTLVPEGHCFTIGKRRSCDMVLDDPYVSSVHCALEPTSHGTLSIRDRDSTNGTFLDGNRIQCAELRTGAVIRLGHTILLATGRHSEQSHGEKPADQPSAIERLHGRSRGFRRAVETALTAAAGDCNVLVIGETGTGKELIARAVHEASSRAQSPMISVNCGAITAPLIGSELFGHEKGAFTGAERARDGVFAQADGGTLFLDEIGELPIEQQPHLLRVLETRQVKRLGGNDERPVDVRLIAATNRMCGLDAKDSPLRLDLYHRLATVIVELPPLRQRSKDIPVLIQAFIEEFRPKYGHRDISSATLHELAAYPWPGNVRELRSAILRAMTLDPRELQLKHLLPQWAPPEVHGTGGVDGIGTDPDTCLEQPRVLSPYEDSMRRQMIAALESHQSLRQAARALGMARSTFSDRARRFGIYLPRSAR